MVKPTGPKMTQEKSDKDQENSPAVPAWVKVLCEDIPRATRREMDRLEKWFSDASGDAVALAFEKAKDRRTEQAAARTLTAETLRELEGLLAKPWSADFLKGLAQNPCTREIPEAWDELKENLTDENAYYILQWITLEDAGEIVDYLSRHNTDALLVVLKNRPEIVNFLGSAILKDLLASENKAHRAAVILALGKAKGKAAPSSESPKKGQTRSLR